MFARTDMYHVPPHGHIDRDISKKGIPPLHISIFLVALVLAVLSLAAGLSKLPWLQGDTVSLDSSSSMELGSRSAGVNPGNTEIILPQNNTVAFQPMGVDSLLPPLLSAEAIALAREVRTPTIPEDPVTERPQVPNPAPAPEPSRESDDPTDPESNEPNITLNDFFFVGDSIAVGFHQYKQAAQEQLLGRIGAGSTAITDELIPILEEPFLRPRRVLLVSLGTNDSLGYETTFARNVSRIAKTAQKQNLCVLWMTVHRYEGDSNWASYNEVLRAAAQAHANLHLIDWAAVAVDNPQYLYDDGVHIKPDGYRALWSIAGTESLKCA